MNRPKAHHMFVIASVYLLGIIVIMGLFIAPQLKERFAAVPTLEEEFPLLVSNYTSYPFEGKIIWIEQANKVIPVISAEKYDSTYIYTSDAQTENNLNYERGVFVGKKQYVIYHQTDSLTKPTLFGPFKI